MYLKTIGNPHRKESVRYNFDIVNFIVPVFSVVEKSGYTPVIRLGIWFLLWGGFGGILLIGSGMAGVPRLRSA
jgi:hypothetical protein